MRETKHCPECDGQEIYQTAYWTWSVEKQDWKCDDDDVITCPSCGYSGYKIVTKEMKPEDAENV